jgi:hypothetical protein
LVKLKFKTIAREVNENTNNSNKHPKTEMSSLEAQVLFLVVKYLKSYGNLQQYAADIEDKLVGCVFIKRLHVKTDCSL